MKTRKLIFALTLGTILALKSHGQQVDPDRMEKDLKVAETILESLTEDKNQLLALDRQYNPMRLNKGNVSVYTRPNWQSSPVSSDSQYLGGFGVIIRFDAEKGRLRTYSSFEQPSNERINYGMDFLGRRGTDPAEKRDKVRTAYGRDMFGSQGTDISEFGDEASGKDQLPYEEGSGEDSEKIKDAMITYLLDYADLIGQLKPEDKIMVAEKPRQPFLLSQQGGEMEHFGNSWSAVITKADLDAYKSGDISRFEVINKISFREDQPTKKISQDVVMLLNIMERLYAPDISSTYYLQRKSSVEYFGNFGVVYNFDFYSSIKKNEDNFDMPTLGLNGLTQIERDHKVKKLYLQFLTELKQQIITYGKTVKSLQSEETLMFRVNLTACQGCGIPESLEISVNAAALNAFEKGEISEKQILNQLTVIEKSGEA